MECHDEEVSKRLVMRKNRQGLDRSSRRNFQRRKDSELAEHERGSEIAVEGSKPTFGESGRARRGETIMLPDRGTVRFLTRPPPAGSRGKRREQSAVFEYGLRYWRAWACAVGPWVCRKLPDIAFRIRTSP